MNSLTQENNLLKWQGLTEITGMIPPKYPSIHICGFNSYLPIRHGVLGLICYRVNRSRLVADCKKPKSLKTEVLNRMAY